MGEGRRRLLRCPEVSADRMVVVEDGCGLLSSCEW